jgi:hypothetical protein
MLKQKGKRCALGVARKLADATWSKIAATAAPEIHPKIPQEGAKRFGGRPSRIRTRVRKNDDGQGTRFGIVMRRGCLDRQKAHPGHAYELRRSLATYGRHRRSPVPLGSNRILDG